MSMWPTFLGIGAAAMTAGALAIPAARRIAVGDIAFDWLAGELDLDHVGSDRKTVYRKDGGIFRVVNIRGQAFDTKPLAEQEALLAGRQDLFKQLGELGVTVRLHGVKRSRDVSTAATWPSPVLEEIGASEAAAFRASFSIHWYLIISNGGDVAAMDRAERRTHALLGAYAPATLYQADTPSPALIGPMNPGARSEGGTGKPLSSCPLTGFLCLLVCGETRRDVPALGDRIGARLPAAELHFGEDGTILSHGWRTVEQRVISIREWPGQISGECFGDLMALAGEIEICFQALPISHERALAGTVWQRRQVGSLPFSNRERINGFVAAEELLSEGCHVFDTQCFVVCRSSTPEGLRSLQTRIEEICGRRRVLAEPETMAAPAAWFSRIPGNDRLVRPLKLFDRSIAGLWAFPYAPVGLARSAIGDQPVRMFPTPTGPAYAMQFQASDRPQSLGNYLVFAPAGSGKSTLIMHLLGGLAKFEGHRSYIFDSKEGARFMIEAMGGVYQTYDKLHLNPLDVGGDSTEARQCVQLMMRAMIGSAADDVAADDALRHAVEVAFEVEPPDRTFNNIFELGFEKNSPVGKAMARWVVDGKGTEGLHAHVFNAPYDSLAGFLERSHLIGINMNEALADPMVGPPVVAHISAAIWKAAVRHSAEAEAGGRPAGFNIFIDEAANLLRNDGFKAIVAEMFREYRKLNGAVGLAFQDPAALHASGIAEAVLENTATLLFFPNVLGSRESYDAFNLNEEQLRFIFGGDTTGGRRVLLVKREAATGFEESVILDVDLAPLGDVLRFYRAGTDAVRDLEHLQAAHGDDWIEHV